MSLSDYISEYYYFYSCINTWKIFIKNNIMRSKIALVGGGLIGANIGLMSGLSKLGDVVMYDIVEGLPQGKCLDMSAMLPIKGCDIKYKGSNDYSIIEGADVVVVTAGVPRKPGMTRDDLISINSSIIRSVGENIKKYCPKAFVICITNPLDSMVWLLKDVANIPSNMICGMAGILDSARMRMLVAEKLNVSVIDVNAIVLGGHGDTMVPVPRLCTVGGIPLPELVEMGSMSAADMETIIARTKDGGGEVVALLKTGSASVAPAAAALEMVEAYLLDQKRILPCSAWLTGAYGHNNIYMGVPVVIGAGGVEKIVEVKLTDKEKEEFAESAKAVQRAYEAIPPAK